MTNYAKAMKTWRNVRKYKQYVRGKKMANRLFFAENKKPLDK